jgi:hypothetical protein
MQVIAYAVGEQMTELRDQQASRCGKGSEHELLARVHKT